MYCYNIEKRFYSYTNFIDSFSYLKRNYSLCYLFSSSRQSFSSGEDSSDSELVDHDYNSHIFAAKKVINKGRWSTEEVRCSEGGVKYRH